MRIGNRQFRVQSAMEYLMTYGWSILIIAIVLGAMFQMGLFGKTSLIPSGCISSAPYFCSKPVLSSNGMLTIQVSQIGTYSMTITGTNCSNSGSAPTVFNTNLNPTTQLRSGASSMLTFRCPVTSNSIGTPFQGRLWISYTSGAQSGQASLGSISLIESIAGPTLPSLLFSWGTFADYGGDSINNGNTGPLSEAFSCATSNGYVYCVGGYNMYAYSSNVSYAPINSMGVGLWTQTTDYAGTGKSGATGLHLLNLACAIYNGYIYCVGGAVTGTMTSKVFYAPVSSSGVGAWTETTDYGGSGSSGLTGTPISAESCAISVGYIYCVGGSSGSGISKTFYAPVSSSGVGAWTETTDYGGSGSSGSTGTPVNFESCAIYNSYIYCVGGSGLRKVFYAPVSSSGIGTWTETTDYAGTGTSGSTGITVAMHSCSAAIGYIYCVGGVGNPSSNKVYFGPVSASGIVSWTETTDYAGSGTSGTTGTGTSRESCVISGSYLYCFGGISSQGPLSDSYFTTISSSGVGAWTETTDFENMNGVGVGLLAESPSCAAYGGYAYCAGGQGETRFLNKAFYASLTSSGIASWTETTDYAGSGTSGNTGFGIAYNSCAIYSGYIYCVGGQKNNVGSPYDISSTFYAPVSSAGIGAWTETTDYGGPGSSGLTGSDVAYHSCVAYNGYIYCFGGWDINGNTMSKVFYAPVSSTGIGTWTETTDYGGTGLTGSTGTKIAEHSCVVSNGYVYCIGGYDGSNMISKTFYAQLSSTGVGPWTETTDFNGINTDGTSGSPGAACVLSNSKIICFGSANNDGVTTSAAYAPVSSSGIGQWTVGLNSFPDVLYGPSCVFSGGYMYCVNIGPIWEDGYYSQAI